MSSTSRFLPAFGITGGVGAGKSEVCRLLHARGYPVVSFDELVGELAAPSGAAFREIFRQFGTNDRSLIRERVFTNPVDRAKVEAILHPRVVELAPKRIAEALSRNSVPFAFFEAALLFESSCDSFLKGSIAVVAPKNVRIERAIRRNPDIPRSIFESIARIQLSDEALVTKSDFVLENSGSRLDLEAAVDELLEKLVRFIQK
jgi:dephospho-CoA kinase